MMYICAALLLLLIFREVLHFFERRDLYNRIMSGSLKEYKAATSPERAVHVKSAHRRAIEKWRDGGGD